MPTVQPRPLTRTQELVFVMSGVVVAFSGLAQLSFAEGSVDKFLAGALLMVGNWMLVPHLIASAVKRQKQ